MLISIALLPVLCAVLLLCVSSAAPKNAVRQLTSKSYEAEIDANEFSMVAFYTPSCAYCEALLPEYAKAAKLLSDMDNVRLAKLDCSVNQEFCSQKNVTGFPTVMCFRKNATSFEYDGAPSADAIATFVKLAMAPLLTELSNQADVDQFTKTRPAVVAVVAFTDDESSRTILAGAAERLWQQLVSFGIAPAALSPSPEAHQLYMFAKFSEAPIALPTYTSIDDIVNFVQRESFPLVQEITPENHKSYTDRGFPIVWAFLSKDDVGSGSRLETLREAAAASRDALSWVFLDGELYSEYGESLGIVPGKYPGVVIQDLREKPKRFVFDGAFEAAALEAWAARVQSGELAPSIRSEAVPEEGSHNPLTKIVGLNYENIVLDASKDVLLEVYAPWCDFCKAIAPKYEAVAENFKDDNSIVVSQIDGTANDIPLDVEAFPTIVFFPAGSKQKPLVYDGEPSANSLAAFIARESNTLSEQRKKEIVDTKLPEPEAPEDEADQQEDDGQEGPDDEYDEYDAEAVDDDDADHDREEQDEDHEDADHEDADHEDADHEEDGDEHEDSDPQDDKDEL